MRYCFYDSPIGQLLLGAINDKLSLLGFPSGNLSYKVTPSWQYTDQPFTAVIKQLNEYFAQKRKHFEIDYELTISPFQQRVLAAVSKVPYGSTTNYGQIAAAINQPKAARAVGLANAKNPLPIIIPCHRIIGSDGSLTGFGGGLETKSFLLQLEAGL